MKNEIFFLSLITILTVSSCSNNTEEDIDTNNTLYTEVLTDVALNVITETYNSLYTNAKSLNAAVNTLTIGDELALQTVKDAWQSTRAPWEKSEGFLYGPVATNTTSGTIDEAIDSWPVDVNAINNILNSNVSITSSLLDTNNEARGFHTIEYFVWGLNGTKAASALTAREIEYLKAATQNLETKTQDLYNGWLASEGNFAKNFINAGTQASLYKSQKGALQEIVEGLVIIADEVANGKIETPLNGNSGAAKPEVEESRFSNNSKLDFANNIRSIQNIYLGDYNNVNRKGISDIVITTNTALDASIKTAISEAISAIEAIPGTFTNAIVNNRAEVQNAQTKVAALLTILETKLVPFISNL